MLRGGFRLPAQPMHAEKPRDPIALNRLYGRSVGRPLRKAQQEIVDTLLPKVCVPLEGEVTAAGLFGNERPLHFEIGFGGGEHMAGRADLLPDHGFIGAEPFLNGVVSALSHVKEQKLGNVRIHHGDALQVLARIPDGALSFAYLLHPDPWPKPRHARRRMMNDGPVEMLAAKLKPGGEFRFGTDHPIYLRHALMIMRRHTDTFEWLVEGPADWQNRPDGWDETRYEAKARQKGHEIWYYRFRRK